MTEMTDLSMLLCPRCGAEKLHRIVWRNGSAVETVCTACGRALQLPWRRSLRVRLGPYPLGGGAPILLFGRVPSGLRSRALAAAVREMADAGCHAVEVDGRAAGEPGCPRLAGEAPVAIVADAGQRSGLAYQLLTKNRAQESGISAVRWVYNRQRGHLALLLAAARRRGMLLLVSADLRSVELSDVVEALAASPDSGHAVLSLESDDPGQCLAGYEKAAKKLSCPFHLNMPLGPAGAGRTVAGGEQDGLVLERFLRQRLGDSWTVAVGGSVRAAGAAQAPAALGSTPAAGSALDAAARVAEARELLMDLWLPVAARPPRVQMTVARLAHSRKGPLPPARTLLAGWPARIWTKPGRLWREVLQDGAGALLSMPGRAATKPVRIMGELGRRALAGRFRPGA